MEPILPMPNNLENASPVPNAVSQPGLISPETNPNNSVEQPREGAPVMTTPPQPSLPVVAPQPVAPPAQLPQQPIQTTTPDPQIADDVDVIEKEWVDKAKHIVCATKEDPHQQGKEVGKLQADYLMKRYNKKIKLTE